jgi:hypothetical protein
LSFVNFNEELPFFVDRVLPLLRQAGLREDDQIGETLAVRYIRPPGRG